jgi:hypothetical protein
MRYQLSVSFSSSQVVVARVAEIFYGFLHGKDCGTLWFTTVAHTTRGWIRSHTLNSVLHSWSTICGQILVSAKIGQK